MFRPLVSPLAHDARSVLAAARRPALLIVTLLLSACADRPVVAPEWPPSAGPKPALAAPPASMMTPHGY